MKRNRENTTEKKKSSQKPSQHEKNDRQDKQLIKKSCLYIKNAHNQGYMLFLYFHFFQLFNYWLVSTLVIFYIHTAHSYIRGWFYNIRYLNKQNFLHREGRKKKIIKNGAEWVREWSKRRREKKESKKST